MTEGSSPAAANRRLWILIAAAASLLLLEGALILVSAMPKSGIGNAAVENTAESGRLSGLPAPDKEERARLFLLREALELENIRNGSVQDASDAARAWVREISALRPLSDRDVAEALPDPAFFLARTASQSDVYDIRDSAKGESAFARAYKPIDEAMPGSNAAGARVEAVLDVIYGRRLEREVRTAGQDYELQPPLAREDRWIGSEESLKGTHKNALDVFFRRRDGKASSEKGPVIRSMSPGIVVAAAGDWAGGEGAGKYRHGGLTPKAGNGAIVYNPVQGRYYTYFHMHDVSVRPGQMVASGTVLGHGGNTGTNARRRGHGGHLHLEIWDAKADRPLSCYELRTLLLSL